MVKFSTDQLKTIAKALNILLLHSERTNGVEMNTYHFMRFANSTHYIDYSDRKKFRVYKHYKGIDVSLEKKFYEKPLVRLFGTFEYENKKE